MAAQTVSPPPTPRPSAEAIGNAFVQQYFHILYYTPELAYRFYQDKSLFSRPDPNGLMTTVTTTKAINEKIVSLDYKNYKIEIYTADAQDSYENGVVVLVTGCWTERDNLRRKFMQTFFLAPQDKGYYVLNDVFRYVQENGPDTRPLVDLRVQETPLESNPEPAQVVDSTNTNHASSQVHEVKIIEDVLDDQAIEVGQAVNNTDKMMETDSHLNENHVTAAAESLPSSQEDAPKKSYASIVSSQTKKGPTKVYVRTKTAKVVPAIMEKQPVNAAEHPAPESSGPFAPDNAPESKDTQDEVEGHSIYIRNLPLDVTVSQLESEFQKFGAIKPNGVQVRSNKLLSHQHGFCYGFVEFQEFSSMQSAIKASPIIIGDRQATVEIKRATARVGGRGRFTPRGGYRNENFRGHGNFNRGRTYVRSDSLRGRGNFSSGRSGEGYQQGRGRGSRRSSPTQYPAAT